MAVDLVAVGAAGVEALLTLGLRALTGGADVHHARGALDVLGHREGPGVERVHELRVVLGDHAGAATVGPVELDQLEVEQGATLATDPCSSSVNPRDTHPGQ